MPLIAPSVRRRRPMPETGRARGGGSASRHRQPRQHRRRRKERSAKSQLIRKRVIRGLLATFLIISGYVGITMYPYLSAPGTEPLAARVAEWGRDHYMSWLISYLENLTYTAPPTGGALSADQRKQLLGPKVKPPPPAPSAVASPPDLPTNIIPQAANPLPGEGVWHPVVYNQSGVPIIEEAALRPDSQHTSELAYAAWMNQKALTFTLQPGFHQPGGTWPVPDVLSGSALNGLVATWNGAFKLTPNDALGGFYLDGTTAIPLVTGQASEVFYQNGSVTVGAWGTGNLTMSPNVVGVRQNLSLLVNNGQVEVTANAGSSTQWGYTINNAYYIARSGIGITPTGDIVYISGSALSVYTLAELLKAAGCVNGMELDINPDWVSYMTYTGNAANPNPVKLWNFVQPADRYLQPSDRDFVSVHLRQTSTATAG